MARSPGSKKVASEVLALLDSKLAHLTARDALRGFPRGRQGEKPPGFPHSGWQLLEHLRLAQKDILDYCLDRDYREGTFPDDYWPRRSSPPRPDSWSRAVRSFLADLATAKRLVLEHADGLLEPLPYVSGVTWLQEMLLIADHNAYHLGQLVQLGKVLKATPRKR